MLNEVMIANKNYASVVVEDRKKLDTIAMQVIRYDCPQFLLPIRLVGIDNEIQLRYEITGGIRLAYMPLQMNRNDLNKLLNQLLLPYVDCADWFLDFHNFYLDRNYMMVEQNDFKVKYIYLPYGYMSQTDEQILRFFCDLVMDVELQEDQAYITTLLRCLMGKDASVTAFANLIKENLRQQEAQTGNNVVVSAQLSDNVPVKASIVTSAPEPEETENAPQPAERVSKNEYGMRDLANFIEEGLFGENEKNFEKKPVNKKAIAKKTSAKKISEKKAEEKKLTDKKPKETKNFLGRLLGTEKKSSKETVGQSEPYKRDDAGNANIQAVVKIERNMESPINEQRNYELDTYKTELSNDDEEISGMLRLRLERAQVDNIPNQIDLDLRKGYAVIGRYDKTGKLSADFNFDMSLTFIGRRHARFELSGEEMYIIDLESKNHTYLNQEELLPNRRYLLHKGDRITLTQKYGIVYMVC